MNTSKPLKTLIVGGGSIGERHLRCAQQTPGFEVALCENRTELRQQLAERYHLRETFASVDAAAEQTWDAAVICTPAHLHVTHAVQLAPVTTHFMIEKPLSIRLEEIPQLQAALAGKTVNVAYVYRAHPAVEEAKRELARGTIGKLVEVTLVAGQHFPTFRPAYREIYYTRHETGGGAIQDAITHMFDLTQHLAGRYDWIFCDYEHLALEGVEVEDTVHLLGRMNHGKTLVSLALNQFMAPNETRLALNGDRGSIQIPFDQGRWGILRHGDTEWDWRPFPLKERDDLFRLQASKFYEACLGDLPPLCPLEDAIHTLKINLAALKSAGRERVAIEV